MEEYMHHTHVCIRAIHVSYTQPYTSHACMAVCVTREYGTCAHTDITAHMHTRTSRHMCTHGHHMNDNAVCAFTCTRAAGAHRSCAPQRGWHEHLVEHLPHSREIQGALTLQKHVAMAHVYVCVHVCAFGMYFYVCVRLSLSLSLSLCVCVYIYIYIYIYIYTTPLSCLCVVDGDITPLEMQGAH
jgi:hypothetical protein